MALDLDTAHELASLSGLVLTAADDAAALHEVVGVAERVIPTCDGVSATMREHGTATSSAASNPWAEELDTLQVVVQEGPCLNCMREGAIMRVPDLERDGRFPTYGPQAAESGAAATLSVPLMADGRTVGALNFYSRKQDAFDNDDVAVCMLVAAHAELGLQAAHAYLSSQSLATQLQGALSSRVVIEQAKGVLMAQRGCDSDTAFASLVELSQRSNRKLREIAELVVQQASANGGPQR
ncbi:MAG: GAF and ANTAR domain-containing protein [Streptomyces sp.]|uniref:GAF and ANTAR domain-containing protein n=1 Tax=Streptomyces sp. TaxID=1931 RepID=UPI0025CDA039|nr:GAF and ANTAR domain-containing protein [Streptomyces sp.]MBW8801462.1 GAF and ANTAR domain-containing protein [Streptomyces sp.]